MHPGSVRFEGNTLQVNLACDRLQNVHIKNRARMAHCKRRYVEREKEQERKRQS